MNNVTDLHIKELDTELIPPSTINCLKKLGVTIKKDKDKSYYIHGKGLGSLFAKKNLRLYFLQCFLIFKIVSIFKSLL